MDNSASILANVKVEINIKEEQLCSENLDNALESKEPIAKSRHLHTRHERTHRSETPLNEEINIKEEQLSSENLDNAVEWKKPTGKFRCRYCDKNFRRSNMLADHERTHTGERPFECNLCNKTFSLRRCLLSHLATHSLGKPYICKYCNQKFKQKVSLSRHERTHRSESPLNEEVKIKEEQLSSENLDNAVESKKLIDKFQCRYCDRNFKRSNMLADHERTHTGERPFECNLCNKNFSLHRCLLRHLETHSLGKPFICKYCNQKFKQKSSLSRHLHTRHERTHRSESPLNEEINIEEQLSSENLDNAVESKKSIGKFQCRYCDRNFKRSSMLADHERTHTGERPFECNLCNKKFSFRRYLLKHLATHSEEKPFTCNYCNRKFKHKFNLTRHLHTLHERTHTGETPLNKEINKEQLCSENLDNAVESEKPPIGKFQCRYCDRNFKRSSMLADHERTHTGERPFECNLCNKKFSLRRSLLKHLATHSEEKPFTCNYCNRKFKHKFNLTRHLHTLHERTHTGETPLNREINKEQLCSENLDNAVESEKPPIGKFQCRYCDRNFKKSNMLADHERAHTGERPFECNLCNKTFSLRRCLLKHLAMHSEERPFICNYCNQKFKHKCNLLRHLRKQHEQTRTGGSPLNEEINKQEQLRSENLDNTVEPKKPIGKLQCGFCDRDFKRSNMLADHERTHTGERPFECNVCNKTFSLRRCLIRHLATHSEEKRFICKYCNRKFKHKISLSRHLRTRHERTYTGGSPLKEEINIKEEQL